MYIYVYTYMYSNIDNKAPQTSPVSLTRRQPALAHEAIRQLLEVTESLAEAAL